MDHCRSSQHTLGKRIQCMLTRYYWFSDLSDIKRSILLLVKNLGCWVKYFRINVSKVKLVRLLEDFQNEKCAVYSFGNAQMLLLGTRCLVSSSRPQMTTIMDIVAFMLLSIDWHNKREFWFSPDCKLLYN